MDFNVADDNEAAVKSTPINLIYYKVVEALLSAIEDFRSVFTQQKSDSVP